MDTLQDLIQAVMILGQSILALRIIICAIRERDIESNEIQNYKKQKKSALIALIIIVCVYDIPALLQQYIPLAPSD